MSLFGYNHHNFGVNIQQDAQEFIRLFLEELSSELNEIKNIPNYTEINYTNKSSKISSNEKFHELFLKREKSFIIDLFYTQIITTLTCMCKHEHFSFQKLLDIPLNIPMNVHNLSLLDILNNYFINKAVEELYSCEICHKKNKQLKKILISKLPKILILSIQRFDYTKNIKNESNIEIPQSINMNTYIDKDCYKDNNIIMFYFQLSIIWD